MKSKPTPTTYPYKELRKQAKLKYQDFVRVFAALLKDKETFDLIIAAGDSGAVMAYYVKTIYSALKKPLPPILYLPIQRFTLLNVPEGTPYDNSLLVPEVKKQLEKIKKFEKILFVDDEILKAFTAKTSIEVVLKSIPKSKLPKRMVFTIIAENHGFQWHTDIPPVSIRYFSFAKRTPWVNGAVFNLLDEKTLNKYGKKLGKIKNSQIMSLVLNGFIKHSTLQGPRFSPLPEIATTQELKIDKNKLDTTLNKLTEQALKQK